MEFVIVKESLLMEAKIFFFYVHLIYLGLIIDYSIKPALILIIEFKFIILYQKLDSSNHLEEFLR